MLPTGTVAIIQNYGSIGKHKQFQSRAGRARGFTIVELLIVIVVIAILASISTVAYAGIQERSRRASAMSDLKMLEKAIIMARIHTNKTLLQITGSNCTYCIGGQVGYEAALDAIGTASGMNLASLKKGDPWGDRYRID